MFKHNLVKLKHNRDNTGCVLQGKDFAAVKTVTITLGFIKSLSALLQLKDSVLLLNN